MNLYRILSLLLDYPDGCLDDHLDELEAALERDPGLTPRERESLAGFLAWRRATPLLELQQHYVQVFDLTPDHSLHLTHHAFGDDRRRGPALAELVDLYRAFGFELSARELPDYLPLVLEFIAAAEPEAARALLARLDAVLALLAERLERAASPYGALLALLAARAKQAATAEVAEGEHTALAPA
jgi:nitrate reductase delta subunit